MGYEVSRRTVERDLAALACEYAIECDDRDKPFGWSWRDDAAIPLTPDMDLPQALALLMMERESGNLMPHAAREALAPWLAQARQRVQQSGQAKATRWLRKVALHSLGPPLLAPKVASVVLERVTEALFTEVQIEAEYRGAQSTTYRAARLHPLGLIRTGLVTYLVVRFDGYDDARLLALHRMRRVHLLEQAALPPAGFDLNEFIHDGGLNFGDGPATRVRLRMTGEAAMHLYDTPLSLDQTIDPCDEQDGCVIVTATVRDSPRLTWWIRGFGEQAQRLE